MKIIQTDNFDRESVSDVLVAENVHNFYAAKITEFLNGVYGGDNSPFYFCAVEDDHKLYVFEP